MLHQINSKNYPQIGSLFEVLNQHNLYCAAVLAGSYPGRVYVDDPNIPKSALVTKDDTWFYLGGDVDNEPFLTAVRRGLAERTLIGEQAGAIFFTVTSEAWLPYLDTLILNRLAIDLPRYLYRLPAQELAETRPLPEGLRLHFIDKALGNLLAESPPGDVQKVLDLRANAEIPDETAFGVVVLDGETYAAYAKVDAIANGRGEISLVTMEPYRRRGLATAVSAAAIDYGFEHGISYIHWDCAAHNLGSIRTAEKLGFKLVTKRTEYLLVFPEFGYLINRAWSQLDAGNFEETLERARPLLDLERGRKYAHFLTAAAWAGLKESDKVLTAFSQAIDVGWDDIAETNGCKTFAYLKGTAEWEALLKRM